MPAAAMLAARSFKVVRNFMGNPPKYRTKALLYLSF